MAVDRRSEEQAIALAAVLQAAWLVDQIARTGQVDTGSYTPLIHSLFAFDPPSTEQIYGGAPRLELGLRLLVDVLRGQRQTPHQATLRYALGALYLERKVAREPEMLAIMHSRLQHAEKKMEHFTDDVDAVASSVAAIYQDTVSNFKYRIQITGSMQQLQNPANADRIRALLLAAIRAAVLWRQVGGSRWQLLLRRGRLLRAAEQLLGR